MNGIERANPDTLSGVQQLSMMLTGLTKRNYR